MYRLFFFLFSGPVALRPRLSSGLPISNFGPGLQKALSYLPSTYATSLIKNHMLHGVFREMERKNYPDEMVEAKETRLIAIRYFMEMW